MAKERLKLSDQIRTAVDASGLSRYRIAREIGIAESGMSRFMNGQGGLSWDHLDRLADLLGLSVTTAKKTTTGGRKKKG